MSFYWKKIGSIPTINQVSSLRFNRSDSNGGNLAYCSGSNYVVISFTYNPSIRSFIASETYNQEITNLASSWPTSSSESSSGEYAYQTTNGINIRYSGFVYTLHTGSVGSSSILDASPEFNIAYSYNGSGGSGRFLKFGKFFLSGGTSAQLGGFIDTGLLGPTSISRNGLFATVAGVPSGGTIRNTIKVYTTSNGLPPTQTYFTAIQAGNTITIPGTANISQVKINNAGTRLAAYTSLNIYTYELISGSWVERSSLASPASNSGTGIALSSDGGILTTRGNSVAVSYSWDSGSNSWQLVDETTLITPMSYIGRRIDISGDAKYMAVDVWPTTNSTAIEIYEKINSPNLYKGSAQSRRIYFGGNPCEAYYGSKRL